MTTCPIRATPKGPARDRQGRVEVEVVSPGRVEDEVVRGTEVDDEVELDCGGIDPVVVVGARVVGCTGTVVLDGARVVVVVVVGARVVGTGISEGVAGT
jgi:hypothetical protein